MRKSAIDSAQSLMRRRKFSSAIKVLQGRSEIYEEDFTYYVLLGTACLYVGDTGSAYSYYEKARRIKMTDVKLLLGQAAIFLRRGDTDRAVRYYLDILETNPGNKIASAALEFVRKANYELICKWVDSGKIEQFYPPLGVNPDFVFTLIGVVALGMITGFFAVNILFSKPKVSGNRADLSSFVLSVEDATSVKETDLSHTVYNYILSDKQILKSYELAQSYFQSYRDNAAQVEINRILNSNASPLIRKKTRLLMTYLVPQTFDSLKDNYNYATVSSDPSLYLDCWVDWTGRITNAQTIGEKFSFDLLIGYEDLKTVEGIIPVGFDNAPYPAIDGEKAVRVLGKIGTENGKLKLTGYSVYQGIGK